MPDLRQGGATGKSTEEITPADALVLFGAKEVLANKTIFPCHSPKCWRAEESLTYSLGSERSLL